MGFLDIANDLGPSEQVRLVGWGTEPAPDLLSLAASYAFGDVMVGLGGANTNILTNLTPEWIALHGTGEINSISIAGDAAFALGTVTNATTSSTVAFPLVIGTGDVIQIPISCNPTIAGEVYATLSVLGGDGKTYTTNLSGMGIDPEPHISVSPNSVIMSVMEESSGTGGFYVKNTGTADLNFNLNVSSLPSWINLSPDYGTVHAGDSLYVTINANTTGIAVGYYSNLCYINSNDALAATTNLMITVNVTSLPLVADFHASVLSGHAALTVNFTDDSHSDPTQAWSTINSWKWDFNNDGVFDAYIQNPSYTYTLPGIYSVRLVVSTNTGSTASKLRTDYISATNISPQIVTPLDTISMTEDTQWGPTSVAYVFNDPDSDPITISCNGSPHINASIAAGYLTLVPALNWNGAETITIKAVDQFGKGATQTTLVTVAAVNDAPILTIPSDLYFIRNTSFMVDFAPYIDDPDNTDAQLSIMVTPTTIPTLINFAYAPVNAPNVVGQLGVVFSSPSQIGVDASFIITVNDNMGRLVATASFTMHVIEHFLPRVTIGATYQYAGQTVAFNDTTLGNPDHWFWDFGDGSTSTLQHPQHQYLNAGTYDISLTLGNSQVPDEDRQLFIPGMIHLSGTAVTVTFVPDTWTVLGSPYNIYGNVVIDNTSTVVVQDNVVVNLFNEQPLQILGAIQANGATFQPQTGSGRWGGFRFRGPGLREPSSLTNCQIIDALIPLDIEGQSPILSGLYIAVSDTTVVADSVAIRIKNSASNLNNIEVLNYRGGISIDGNTNNRETPTLTNIRVRNSSNTQRIDAAETTGVSIKSTAIIDNLEVDNCSTGLAIGTENEMNNNTPTLTNIRVRNSSNTTREILNGNGIRIFGNAAPHITGLNVSEVANGIIVDNVVAAVRDTPTLTNIRVRNSSNTTRSITNGLVISNTPAVVIEDAWFDDFASGITIQTDTRSESTPTLTNIRVRNASNTQRTETMGINISGSVNARLNDVVVEDYYHGINYSMTNSTRTTETVTLTNIRVRNSSNTQRQLATGVSLSGLGLLKITDMQIEDFGKGLSIVSGDTRAETTPTLTNIRVRNASNTQREENIGIFLGPGVLGSMKDCVVEDAIVGILLAEGNRTVLESNTIINCATGLRASGSNPLPLRKQLFVLEDIYLTEHPLLDFCALDLLGAGPWSVYQNTITGYLKGLTATNAQVNFHTNIIWSTGQPPIPFINNSSSIQNSYNDILSASGVFPGLGNINSNPLFVQPADLDFRLSRNSPCIDAGNPAMPPDIDGSVADMGYFCYIHKASATATPRFVVVGSEVTFTNTSLGHDYPDTEVAWDIGNNGSIESTGENFSYQFDNPGLYDVKLHMQSGSLVDERVYPGMVVVSAYQLMAPQNPYLQKDGDNISLFWDAVTHTVEGAPISVPFYIIYKAEEPDGFYMFAGLTAAPGTSFVDIGAAQAHRAFYKVLGFVGSRAELMDYIQSQDRASKPGVRQ
jgi:PKD repeat protein